MERLTGWNVTETWRFSAATVLQPRGNSSVTAITGSVIEAPVLVYHHQVAYRCIFPTICAHYTMLDTLFAAAATANDNTEK